MMSSDFWLLILFGGGATVLGLIVFAIVNKKLWIHPGSGALVLLGLMACGLLVSARYRNRTSRSRRANAITDQVVSGTIRSVIDPESSECSTLATALSRNLRIFRSPLGPRSLI